MHSTKTEDSRRSGYVAGHDPFQQCMTVDVQARQDSKSVGPADNASYQKDNVVPESIVNHLSHLSSI